MIRVKHPIEYELTPDAVERRSHWLTVRIKNTGDNDLQNFNECEMGILEGANLHTDGYEGHARIVVVDEDRHVIAAKKTYSSFVNLCKCHTLPAFYVF